MDKKRYNEFMKVFEESSSRESSADPYEDDGEFGSDQDYDPVHEKHNSSSSSSVSVSANTSRNRKTTSTPQNASNLEDGSDTTSESIDSESYGEESSSSESIFETRLSRKQARSRPRTKKNNLQPPNRNSSEDTAAADTVSMDSMDTYILDTLQASPTPDPVGMEGNPSPHATPPPEPVEQEGNSSPHATPPPEPVEQEGNLSPRATPPPEPVEMEGNPGSHASQAPDPVEMADRASPHAPQSPEPAEQEGDPSPHATPPPEPVEMEGNPGFHASQPPYPVEMADSASPHATQPPEPAEQESDPSPHATPPPEPVEMEGNLSFHASQSPNPVEMEDSISPRATPLPEPVEQEGNPSPHAVDDSIEVQGTLLPNASSPPLPPPSSSAHVSRSRSRNNNSNTTRRRGPRCRTPPRDNEWQNSTADIPTFDFDNSSAGVQFEIGPNASVKDVFEKLFPAHIVDFIVARTNEYGRALCSTNRPTTRNSRRYRYKDTDRKEILEFLGLCLLMGQVNVPKKRKLFTYSDALYYHPIFQYIMSARRFEQILRCLCVSELNAPGKEKIIKFIDAVTKNFRDCYKPTKELSLDESLLLFRGRLAFRQYIKSKKARYGIKFYELTTSDGFVLNILMYAGNDEEVEKGKKTEKIVMRLMRPYLLKGHSLYMDNYYNSVTLSQKLLDLKTHTTGTLRSNRKDNPKDITQKKLKKNEHVWTRKNKVYVSKWVDKRPVLMITTNNHPKLIKVSNRYGMRRMKPEEVSQYNQFMSGIDRADQMVSYYSSPRKTLRWYRKVFFHLLDLAVWNSFFIYKKYCKNNSKTYEFLTFREDLIKQLINLTPDLKPEMLMKRNKYDNRLKERTEFVASVGVGNTENFNHWPEKIPIRANSKKTSNYMKCKMCSKKKIRRETSLRCKGCEEKPALCAVCFEEWHSQS